MPVRTALWTVGNSPVFLKESALASEKLLEEMIVTAPRRAIRGLHAGPYPRGGGSATPQVAPQITPQVLQLLKALRGRRHRAAVCRSTG